MPKVPTSDNVVQGPGPQGPEPSETMYLMAAAMMHQEGRLFDQPKAPTGPRPFGWPPHTPWDQPSQKGSAQARTEETAK